MTHRFAVLSSQPQPAEVDDDVDAAARFDPENVFALIDQTARTIRTLQQENERIQKREETGRATLDRDRAQWRDDIVKLKDLAQACLERAAAAEAQSEEAKAQTRSALLMGREAQEREQHAVARAAMAEKRADEAEAWLEKISHVLSSDVRSLLRG